MLGIDEHFFTRRVGYATTFCDLKNHSVYDVVQGRSEASLESYLNRLEGKDLVKVVCMDLAVGYRSLVKKHFPKARIVADRFIPSTWRGQASEQPARKIAREGGAGPSRSLSSSAEPPLSEMTPIAVPSAARIGETDIPPTMPLFRAEYPERAIGLLTLQ